jgi:hypothetical protein
VSDLLIQLIPTAIVGALAPLPVIIVISLLISERGLAKAVSFGVAITGVYAIIGAIVLSTASTDAKSTEGGSAVTGTIVAVLGGVLVIMAVKQLLGAPDPDAGPPKLMTKLDSMSPAGAGVLGTVIALINIKQLGIYVAGISQIVAADISTTDAWMSLIILLVAIQFGVIGPIVIYAFARDWATRVLQSFRTWLFTHNRVISIVLGFGIGIAFLVKGIAQITD